MMANCHLWAAASSLGRSLLCLGRQVLMDRKPTLTVKDGGTLAPLIQKDRRIFIPQKIISILILQTSKIQTLGKTTKLENLRANLIVKHLIPNKLLVKLSILMSSRK